MITFEEVKSIILEEIDNSDCITPNDLIESVVNRIYKKGVLDGGAAIRKSIHKQASIEVTSSAFEENREVKFICPNCNSVHHLYFKNLY